MERERRRRRILPGTVWIAVVKRVFREVTQQDFRDREIDGLIDC
jgi:hypothetical protein